MGFTVIVLCAFPTTHSLSLMSVAPSSTQPALTSLTLRKSFRSVGVAPFQIVFYCHKHNINAAKVISVLDIKGLANPLTAHIGYDTDNRVVAMITSNGIGGPNTSAVTAERCEWTKVIDDWLMTICAPIKGGLIIRKHTILYSARILNQVIRGAATWRVL